MNRIELLKEIIFSNVNQSEYSLSREIHFELVPNPFLKETTLHIYFKNERTDLNIEICCDNNDKMFLVTLDITEKGKEIATKIKLRAICEVFDIYTHWLGTDIDK